MADGRVFDAENDAVNENLLLHISRDIEILLEDKEDGAESNESYIDRKLSEVKFRRMKDELVCELKHFVLSEIVKVTSSFCTSKTSKTNEKTDEKNEDLILKTLNDRIVFLEEEIRFKNQLINKLISKPSMSDEPKLSQQLDIFNSSNLNFENKLSNDDNFCAPKKTISVHKSSTNNTNFIHNNKYESLPIERIGEVENSINENNNDNRSDKRKRYRNNKNKNNLKSIHIIGDSIIKEIKGWKLSGNNNRVVVKTFPGASTNCMKSYVKPTTEKNPDGIILHCGTNDLRANSNPEELSLHIVNLALSLKTDTNSVIVSGITARKDKLSEKVKAVNDILKHECGRRNLGFIDNSNIDADTHLNRSRLHLNVRGTNILGNNFLHAIKY